MRNKKYFRFKKKERRRPTSDLKACKMKVREKAKELQSTAASPKINFFLHKVKNISKINIVKTISKT